MKDFDHENVMNLIGIVNIDENNLGKMPYVIMPLMHNGDLKSFVMDHKVISVENNVLLLY